MDPVYAFNPGVYAAAIQASRDAKELRSEVAKLREEQAKAALRAEEVRLLDLWARQFEHEGLSPVDAEAAARKRVRELKMQAAEKKSAQRERLEISVNIRQEREAMVREAYLATLPRWRRSFARTPKWTKEKLRPGTVANSNVCYVTVPPEPRSTAGRMPGRPSELHVDVIVRKHQTPTAVRFVHEYSIGFRLPEEDERAIGAYLVRILNSNGTAMAEPRAVPASSAVRQGAAFVLPFAPSEVSEGEWNLSLQAVTHSGVRGRASKLAAFQVEWDWELRFA